VSKLKTTKSKKKLFANGRSDADSGQWTEAAAAAAVTDALTWIKNVQKTTTHKRHWHKNKSNARPN